MGPLGQHLVGYLSIFLQVGVLALCFIGEGAVSFAGALAAADAQLCERRSARRS